MVKEQLLRMVRIQEIALETRAALEIVESAPARVEEIEARFRDRNAEYVAVKQRHDALDEDQRTRSGELQLLEENRTKYKADLMQVQNQREYAAMLKEIDAVEVRIAEHEEAILRDMEEIESTKADLESRAAHIQEERKLVETECAEVASAADTARETISLLATERERLETDLPRNLVAQMARLEAGRQGVFLARAEEGTCQSCYVRVRPQVFQEIKLASKVHSCSSCRRLLYHPITLVPDAAEEATTSSATDGPVNAINGEAV